MLVVACGAGVTAGSFVLYPDVKRIVICDIEPLVPKIVTPMFGEENYHIVDGIDQQNPHVVNGKQVEVVYDDGRHFIRTTQEKFDIITSDPIDPWVKGCAALNTVEYYEMCKQHLESRRRDEPVDSALRKQRGHGQERDRHVLPGFPNGIIWSNDDENGEGYDVVLFGRRSSRRDSTWTSLRHGWTATTIRPCWSRSAMLASAPRRKPAATSTRRRGDRPARHLCRQASHLQGWGRDAQINTDRNLRLQYLAGLSLNSIKGTEILSGMLAHYRFPEQTFVGSPARLRAVRTLGGSGAADVTRPGPGPIWPVDWNSINRATS